MGQSKQDYLIRVLAKAGRHEALKDRAKELSDPTRPAKRREPALIVFIRFSVG